MLRCWHAQSAAAFVFSLAHALPVMTCCWYLCACVPVWEWRRAAVIQSELLKKFGVEMTPDACDTPKK